MLTLYDYPDVPVSFEFRNLAAKPDVTYADQYHGQRTGVVVHCEGGMFAGLVGGAAFDRDGKRIRAFEGDGGKGHMENFLQAVRSRDRSRMAAPVDLSHVATTLCHYGNISYRLGESARVEQVRRSPEQAAGFPDFVSDLKTHVETHGVDLDRHRFTLGPWLDLAGDELAAVEGGDPAKLAHGRHLLKETQRPPYQIPDTV